jgi:RNA polymerase sigma factor (sigma-70 family)
MRALFGNRSAVPIFVKNRDLLAAFRSGERSALAEVYRFYVDDVYRLAQFGFRTQGGLRAHSLVREADRLDFTQDVFVRAFGESARLSYDGLRPYRPFLLQVARNLRIDQLRQASREPSAGSLDPSVDIDALIESGSPWPTPDSNDADLHWQQMVRETSSALGGFEAEVRDLARLRFVDELSQAEVATRLGVTRRRVRTLEGRLLAGIRRHLARLGLEAREK